MIVIVEGLIVVCNKNEDITLSEYIFHLGFVPCHRKTERSFVFWGKQFPICARCMSILLGFLSIPILMFLSIKIPFYYGVIMVIPTFLDGFTQLKKWRKSNNFLRFVTGLIAGIGFSVIAVDIAYMLCYLVVDLTH